VSPGAIALDGSCTNPAHAFTVDYPGDWVVNEENGLPPCSAFDPADVAMPEAGEVPSAIAVVVDREPVAFHRVTEFGADPTVRVLSRRDTTVAGREAVAAELEHTGEGFYDRGHRLYSWYVRAGAGTITGTTHDVPHTLPYDVRRQVLDRMMASLRLD
jgi:hypothetical protein